MTEHERMAAIIADIAVDVSKIIAQRGQITMDGLWNLLGSQSLLTVLQYQWIVKILVERELVFRTPDHVLIWMGPTVPGQAMRVH